MTASTLGILLVCGAGAAHAQMEANRTMAGNLSSTPIPVAAAKQLFIDGRFIASSRNVELRMNPPAKLGPVLLPERPWEDKSIGFCASVLEHDGVFKLFYRADSHAAGASVCLATSTDGLHWDRPRIGLYEFGGSKDNNIVFRDTDNSEAYRGVGETVVFLDPHGSPEQRFKLIASKGWPDPKTAGLYCHSSPDGVHWTPGPRCWTSATTAPTRSPTACPKPGRSCRSAASAPSGNTWTASSRPMRPGPAATSSPRPSCLPENAWY